MKKLVLLFAFVLLLTGCTKSYKTIEEYNEAMEAVRQDTDLTVQATYETSIADMFITAYIKDNKWKTEAALKEDAPATVTLFDGDNVITYNFISPFATIVFNKEDLEGPYAGQTLGAVNPASYITDWYSGIASPKPKKSKRGKNKKAKENKDTVFVKNRTTMNGYVCRLIRYKDKTEVCVSDKYGIAVYYKTNYQIQGEEQSLLINVSNIETQELSDDVFEIPDGMTLLTIHNALEKANEAAEKMNSAFEEASRDLKNMADELEDANVQFENTSGRRGSARRPQLREIDVQSDNVTEDASNGFDEIKQEEPEQNEAQEEQDANNISAGDIEAIAKQLNSEVDMKQVAKVLQQLGQQPVN